MMSVSFEAPTVDRVEQTRIRLSPYIIRTPVVPWESDLVKAALGDNAQVFLKLELFQRTGTFKARAALNNMLNLGKGAKVTAISAGNHAIAVAWAASIVGADAKVVMPQSADASRIAATKAYGAETILETNGETAFAHVEELVKSEGRTFIHPFDGVSVAEATGGVALELFEDIKQLDAVVVAIGGGGLAAGVAAVSKHLSRKCEVYGVEPDKADIMRKSIAAGRPSDMGIADTIADSLAPPMVTDYTFESCRRFIDDIAIVTDSEMTAAMALLFSETKLAVEPAGAATTTALFGPLRSQLQGKRIGLIVCGSNIDFDVYRRLIAEGRQALERNVLDLADQNPPRR